MDNIESLEEFYKRKFEWLPENIRKDIGHFNMFELEPFVAGKATAIPYRRRDFYKILLVRGGSRVHYADKVVEVKKQALSFSNPKIPYKWEHLDKIGGGVYCIFNPVFFTQFGQFAHYEVFQPNSDHIFELTDEQAEQVNGVFERIRNEFNSDYKYKYDAIRNLIFELLHFALKLQPTSQIDAQPLNASNRISMLFTELLERQFPIDDSHHAIGLRTASEFAEQLNVHVNHLNRAVKETTQKTTSQVIADRLLQEAMVLLRHSAWSVSEIAYSLGFKEVTHFNNFFKKHTDTSPLKFRKV
ncbi:MAG: helix-turn-helix transcriptional regulator [Imperialibacter sp.]|uniref:helix-turn-helix domain-containing protein n=1 Tax=Imperialibacter sp. TaxID=2038411 RepID=UPI0032EABC00